MRSPTRLATISTPSSSQPVPSPNNLKPCPNLDSFTPISHKARSYSISGSSLAASSISYFADYPEYEPPVEAPYSVAMEEAQNDIHAKLDKLMATHDVIDVDDFHLRVIFPTLICQYIEGSLISF